MLLTLACLLCCRKLLPDLHLSMAMYIILGLGSLAKIVLYLLCTALKHRSDSMLALAEDHCNDVASNLTAIGTATLAILVRPTMRFFST